MYIAKIGDAFHIKRMPHSGPAHGAACEHYEPPPELSGMGQVAGSAVREDTKASCTMLSLDFSLSRGAARAAASGQSIEHDSVRSDGTKLTLRATLHYLYDQARLSRWYPRMRDKRSWGVVRRELLKAASSMRAKGKLLTDLLYLPEPYHSADAQDIAFRRARQLAVLTEQPGSRLILIAPCKSITPARFGHRLLVRNLDMPILMNDKLFKHIEGRFANELAYWDAAADSELLVVATVSQPAAGCLQLESACFVNVDANWLPFESMIEHRLVSLLVGADRSFAKGLRYNLPHSKPLASLVMLDSGNPATAVYIVPDNAPAGFMAELQSVMNDSDLASAVWVSTSVPDELPPIEPVG